MSRLSQAGELFPISDGTLISPFLNPADANQHDLSSEVLSGMSSAAGQILPGVRSKIHTHPFVSAVTYVVDSRLEVRLKGPHSSQG